MNCATNLSKLPVLHQDRPTDTQTR